MWRFGDCGRLLARLDRYQVLCPRFPSLLFYFHRDNAWTEGISIRVVGRLARKGQEVGPGNLLKINEKENRSTRPPGQRTVTRLPKAILFNEMAARHARSWAFVRGIERLRCR
jgi:hypothetical protein